jgi:hypothetical protein
MDGYGLDRAARLEAKRAEKREDDRPASLNPPFPYRMRGFDPDFFRIPANPEVSIDERNPQTESAQDSLQAAPEFQSTNIFRDAEISSAQRVETSTGSVFTATGANGLVLVVIENENEDEETPSDL